VLVFLNGRFVPEAQAVVPVSDRGFLLGDGLFETMRVVGGKPFRFEQHLERMARGANFLKIKLPFTPAKIKKFAEHLVEKNKLSDAVLRMTLTRGAGERGYAPKHQGKATMVMTLHSAPSKKPAGWNLVTSSFRIPAGDPLSSFKTTSKILHIMARIEAIEKDADEALLLNTNGEAVETVSGNLFWIWQDKICTTPIACGALPGITRAVVFEICRTLNLPVIERAIKPEALKKSNGIFLTQSALGIVPVKVFDGEPVAPSPLADQIARAYNEMLMKE
jgi:branched-chain amino acid aminotransferase